MSETKAASEGLPSAGVGRRLGAMLYDSLLFIAVMAVATALLLPFTGGEGITKDLVGPLEYAYQALLVALFIAFFGFFWTRSGQTVGMMAWRLRIEREDGSLLRWSDVVKRLAAATVSMLAVGLGYFWLWVDRDRKALPDRLTQTRVVVLPKRR